MRVLELLKDVERKFKKIVTDRKGYNDIVALARAIVLTVIVAIIGVLIVSQLYSAIS